MNRYPMWKYALIIFAVLFGLLYSSPTLLSRVFGSAPVVQVSEPNAESISANLEGRIKEILSTAGLAAEKITVNPTNVSIQLVAKEQQALVRDALLDGLKPANEYMVSLNTVALTPSWLKAIGAKPVSLGLDLRGGVHFLLQVDMDAAIKDRQDGMMRDIKTSLDDKKIAYTGPSRTGEMVEFSFADAQARSAARKIIAATQVEIEMGEAVDGDRYLLEIHPMEASIVQLKEQALRQNIATLHNRINAIGVGEPIIQQQGLDRIIVQLPGVEDTTQAKDIIGRTATLQIRLVDESPEAQRVITGQGGLLPLGSEIFPYAEGGGSIALLGEVYLTGEQLTNAQSGFAQDTGEAAVFLRLNGEGAKAFDKVTAENVGRRLAIVLFEEGQGTVVTAPKINTRIGGGQVQITGSMNPTEANRTALLLNSGSLAAPMKIIEESVVGPSLGEANIDRGIKSVVYGFIVVALFMCAYYVLFGVFSSISMFVNLLLLITVLSLIGATLTLPGIAAMALALGISIDSNVLINERIREELRAGVTPQMAITAGYEHAWRTILDSNVTSFIAGVALLTCDAGPIRGFAIVHCLGIMTSLFSSVFVSRGIVNFWYGRRRNLKKLAIGQVWKPEAN